MADKAKSSKRKTEVPGSTVFLFDGTGHGTRLTLDELDKADTSAPGAFTWVHLNRMNEKALRWLRKCGIDLHVFEALTAAETRPRCTLHENGVLLNLRGINIDPGEEPEDMIDIRLWIEDSDVISLGWRPLAAIRDLIEAIEAERAPTSPGDLVSRLALRLADRIDPTVSELNEQIDDIEEQVLDDIDEVSRPLLANVRRTAIVLRRYMFPQRDALSTLEIEDIEWLSLRDRSRIREAAERMMRLGEELDAIRDRAQVVHDQVMDNRAERMNRQMLVLSVVAALFLPLSLLTGLLGINVGGMPGLNDHWAFAIVCAVLVVMGLFEIWLFRKIGLF
ncbi:MAG: zinc transporter ZntB [Rhizobiaceae bacterium MnEN-MB40S]|nr:MAG: zinc transporter ZntB [Rhizobiaceae bacterium MnEN-MB40S]